MRLERIEKDDKEIIIIFNHRPEGAKDVEITRVSYPKDLGKAVFCSDQKEIRTSLSKVLEVINGSKAVKFSSIVKQMVRGRFYEYYLYYDLIMELYRFDKNIFHFEEDLIKAVMTHGPVYEELMEKVFDTDSDPDHPDMQERIEYLSNFAFEKKGIKVDEVFDKTVEDIAEYRQQEMNEELKGDSYYW